MNEQEKTAPTNSNTGYGSGSFMESWSKWQQDNPTSNQNDLADEKQLTNPPTRSVRNKPNVAPSFGSVWSSLAYTASSAAMTVTTKGISYLVENIAKGVQVARVRSTLHDRIPIAHAHRALLMARIARIPYSIPRYTEQLKQSHQIKDQPDETITLNWTETVQHELHNYGLELVSTSKPSNQLYTYPSYLICKDVLTQEVIVAVSGTATREDIFTDSLYMPALIHGEIHGHRGAVGAARALYEEMKTILHDLHEYIEKNDTRHEDARPKKSLHFTGHSLGGAIVSLLAVMAAKDGLGDKFIISSVYTFGSPLVFFRNVEPEQVGLPCDTFHHFVNDGDAVPRLLGSSLIMTMMQDLASLVGMDEQTFKDASLSTIQDYKPYGLLWYIMDQTSVIYRVADATTQSVLLQFSGLNWTNKSIEHHKLLRYIEEIKKAIENHKCEDPKDLKSHPQDVTITAEFPIMQMNPSI